MASLNTTFKRSVLTMILFFFFIPPLHANKPEFVYRAEARNPEYIFANGFHSAGENLNIIRHLIEDYQESNNSGFVSVLDNEDLAIIFGANYVREDPFNPGHSQLFWIYRIVPVENVYSIAATIDDAIDRSWVSALQNPYDNVAQTHIYTAIRNMYSVRNEWVARRVIPGNRIVSATRVMVSAVYNADGSLRRVNNVIRLRRVNNPSWDRRLSNPNHGFLDATINNVDNMVLHYAQEINRVWLNSLHGEVNMLVTPAFSLTNCRPNNKRSLDNKMCPATHDIFIDNQQEILIFKLLINDFLFDSVITPSG